MSNLETRSGVKGLISKFMIDKAQLFLDSMSFHAFEEILALLIYGLVQLSNPDQLIDINVVQIFMSRNPIPTLLGDILHSCYTMSFPFGENKRRWRLLLPRHFANQR